MGIPSNPLLKSDGDTAMLSDHDILRTNPFMLSKAMQAINWLCHAYTVLLAHNVSCVSL